MFLTKKEQKKLRRQNRLKKNSLWNSYVPRAAKHTPFILQSTLINYFFFSKVVENDFIMNVP